MDNGFFNPIKDKIYGLFGKGTQAAQAAGLLPAATNPALPSAYQIKPGDSLTSISNTYNVPLDTLIAANNGSLTTPPKGSFINTSVPKPTGAPPVGYGPQPAQRPINGPFLPTKTQSAADNSVTAGRGGLQYSYAGPIKAAQNTITAFNTMNENYSLTGKYDYAALPKEISLATVKQMQSQGAFANAVDANGNPMTPAQALNAYGFEFKNGQFTQTGKPVTATNAGGPQQAGQSMDNKFVAVWSQREGKLVWRNTKGRGDGAVAAVDPEAANVGSSPTSVLDLNIGSG